MSAQAPVYPRKLVPGICPACGDRLVRSARGGWIHEITESVRCAPIQRVCGVCDRDGLILCSEPRCQVIGHPSGGCMTQCVCCSSWGCPAHVSPDDLLCPSCSARQHEGDHEVGTGEGPTVIGAEL